MVSKKESLDIVKNLEEVIDLWTKSFILRLKDSIILEDIKYKSKYNLDIYLNTIRLLNMLFVPKTEIIWFQRIGNSLCVMRKKKLFERLNRDGNNFNKNFKKLNKFERYSEIIRLKGRFLEIPSCCIEKYIEDQKRINLKIFEGFEVLYKHPDEGEISFKRYKKQLKKLGLKDKFKIFKNGRREVSYDLFIPCNPKCKSALKILKDYKKRKRSLHQ